MPFLHVTTHIPNHPYDDLLRKKGGTGFPTLMFLDPEGNKLLKLSGRRTVKAFEEQLGNTEDYMGLVRKVRDGDNSLAGRLLIKQIELDMLSYSEVQKRVESLNKIYAKELKKGGGSTMRARIEAEKKHLAGLLIDVKVRSLVTKAGRDDKKHVDAGKQFLEMWKKEGRVPKGDAERYEFWRHIAHYADVERDKQLFTEVVGEFRKSLGQDRNYSRMLGLLERRLTEWDE